jgi:hypothetical protein
MISMASPKLKKRKRSRTALSYAARTCSGVANADTSMSKVDLGRWKFVSNASTTRYG